MDKKKKRIVVVAIAGLVLAGIGSGVVLAGSGDDEPLSGSTYDRAAETALGHVGEGSVIETEVGDDGAAYGVEIRKDDGSVVEVNLDQDFNVVGTERDDDGADDEDEAGEDDD